MSLMLTRVKMHKKDGDDNNMDKSDADKIETVDMYKHILNFDSEKNLDYLFRTLLNCVVHS
jgi:hypothetical protein